jgi:16S rRNA (cytosine967-C5)-methyltransferase
LREPLLPSNSPPAGAELRAAAARLIARVLVERVAIDDVLGHASPLAARDAPLLAVLVYGALRWHHRLEWQVAQLLTKPLKAEQVELAALLRVGLLQLQELRVPAHAAVSATVDAAAILGHRGAAGLVNAVLRRFQRERDALQSAADRIPTARFSHPDWLVAAVRADWPAEWTAILDANNVAGPLWLRVNLARTTRAAYLERLAAAGIAATAADDVASAVCLTEAMPVEALPGFAAGEVSVQDVAAQRAAGFLDLAPGQRVLDACAAPGGKTGHILEACPGLAEVWAVDRAKRLDLVADNLRRLNLGAQLIAGDAAAPETWWDGRLFDRILVDAPCSALGVIRRHPDIKVLRRPEDVVRVVLLQQRMIRALWQLLAPGGRLVYATCTFLKRENDEQIAAFCAAQNQGGDGEAVVATTRQWLPGEAQGDGFYYAWLVKPRVLRSPSEPLHPLP